MTMKRRVIYMDDATWEYLRAHAAKRATTISEHIRRAVSGGPATRPMRPMTAEEIAGLPAFLRDRITRGEP